MGEASLKFKVFGGVIWRFSERILAQMVTTLVTIVLARILSPEDYGAIAIITIFINICDIFATASFGNALIQKKDADSLDYSSVFYISMFVTVVLYIVLFSVAPFVAEFYDIAVLCPLLRVMGLRIPCAAINSIQNAHISKKFAFKNSFWSSMIGTVISAIVGIYMAYAGYGVWALCAQYLTNTVVHTIILWVMIKWHPTKEFSIKRAGSLFSYGWKLLVSKILEELNVELKSFFIGKVYSASDLAYYNRGKQFPTLVNTNVNQSISTVLFPALALQQDNAQMLKNYMKRSIRIATFVIFPMQLGLFVVAEPLTAVLLTEKWLPSVPFLKIMAMCYLLTPIYTANAQAIKAMGKSQYYLMSSVVSNICGIIIMLILLPYGVIYVAWGGLLSTIVMTVAFSVPCARNINYGLFAQIFDIIPTLLNCAVMVLLSVLAGRLVEGYMAKLAVQIVVGVAGYIATALIIRNDSFYYVLDLLKLMLKRKSADER